MEGTPWVRWLAIALAIIIALLIIALIVSQLSGDEDDDTTTTTTQAETTTSMEETTTTVEETTTTVEETTTTVEETTTTVEETTTTTEAGTALVLADDGIGGADFGATPEETIAYATSQLGPPDDDTGWIDALINPYGVCPEPLVRGVAWGTGAGGGSAFTLLFTNGNTGFIPEGGEHFFGYLYFGGTLLLATVEGITSGSTNQELQTEIPSAVIQEDPLDPIGSTGYWFSDLDPADPDMLWGFSTSVTPTGTLISVNGGSTCGE